MSNSTSFSKRGYLALKKETTAGTVVVPDTYVELMDENIQVSYGLQPVEPIASRRDARVRTVKDVITIEGTINVMVDANTIGYFLEGVLGDATTTTLTADTVYQHVFTPQNTLVTYTMDVQKAGFGFVYRYGGVNIQKITFSQSDNKIMAAIDIQAMNAFTMARVTTAASATDTTLYIDQTTGLHADDTITILDKDDHETQVDEVAITSVDNETTLTIAALSATVDVLDIVVIKTSTASYSLGENMIWVGGSDYKVGAKATNPIDNTSTINAEDYTFELENDLETKHAATGSDLSDRFPSTILTKGFRARGSFVKYFETISQYEDLRNNQVVGTRILTEGATLDTNNAVAATYAFGVPGGANGVVTVTASTAGRAGEDYNVTVAVNDTDDLAASLDGKNILVELANTTAAKNTATLIASAIDALSGVSAAASGDGSTEFTIAAIAKGNLGDTVSGRDANEKESLQISFPSTQYEVFGQDLTEDDIINQEISFEANYDEGYDNETVKVVLRNGVSSY